MRKLFPASWWSRNTFASGIGDLWFKSRASQIRHNVGNGSPPLQRFERSCVARRHNFAKMGSANSLHTSVQDIKYKDLIQKILLFLICGRVDRPSGTETEDSGLIPVWVKQRL